MRRAGGKALAAVLPRAERLPGANTHRRRLSVAAGGSRWASRVHQIIGRAPPREAACQGNGMPRKNTQLQQMVCLMNQQPKTVTGAFWKYKNSRQLGEGRVRDTKCVDGGASRC